VITEPMEGPNPGGPPHPFVIQHNTFQRTTNVGIYESGRLVSIEEISDNRFLGTARTPQYFFDRAIGIHITQTNVRKVRRNVFAGNDVALWLDWTAQSTDLGRPGDPGGNVFHCNSGLDGGYGSDVVIHQQGAPWTGAALPAEGRAHGAIDGGTRRAQGAADGGNNDAADGGPTWLPFAGNTWDHVPPRVVDWFDDDAPNGVEVSLEQLPAVPQFDFSQSLLVSTPCPPGRIP
jgi:hypothetical protein